MMREDGRKRQNSLVLYKNIVFNNMGIIFDKQYHALTISNIHICFCSCIERKKKKKILFQLQENKRFIIKEIKI